MEESCVAVWSGEVDKSVVTKLVVPELTVDVILSTYSLLQSRSQTHPSIQIWLKLRPEQRFAAGKNGRWWRSLLLLVNESCCVWLVRLLNAKRELSFDLTQSRRLGIPL